MGVVEASPWRFSIEDSESGRSIRIPAEREWWPLLFFPVWLAFWIVGEVVVGWALLATFVRVPPPPSGPVLGAGQAAFALLWLAFWTCGGLAAGYWWLWLLNGIEVVQLDDDRLIVRREFLGWARSREYLIGSVTGMRVVPRPERGRLSPIYYISFDYGGRTILFARRRNASELRCIVEALGERHGCMIL